MARCNNCKKEFSLSNYSLCVRCSIYTVLQFDCVECLVQYIQNEKNIYLEEAKELLTRYIKYKNTETRDVTQIQFITQLP